MTPFFVETNVKFFAIAFHLANFVCPMTVRSAIPRGLRPLTGIRLRPAESDAFACRMRMPDVFDVGIALAYHAKKSPALQQGTIKYRGTTLFQNSVFCTLLCKNVCYTYIRLNAHAFRRKAPVLKIPQGSCEVLSAGDTSSLLHSAYVLTYIQRLTCVYSIATRQICQILLSTTSAAS